MTKGKSAWTRPRIGFELFADTPGRRVDLPYRRSPVVILILVVVAAIFTFPAVHTFGQIDGGLTGDGSLFDLTTNLFLLAWLFGWSMGLLLIYTILLVALFGGERLLLRPGDVEFRVGLPWIFLRFNFDPGHITRVERVLPKPQSGHAWRGPHMRFKYDDKPGEFGMQVSEARAAELIGMIGSLSAAMTASQTVHAYHQESSQRSEPLRASPTDRLSAEPLSLASPSTLVLILVNLLPIAGVFLLGWDLATVMVLFWAESGIIGLFNIFKLLVIGRWLGVPAGIFFLGHYGGFMAIHLLFLYAIFVTGMDNRQGESITEVVQYFATLWPMLLALVLSHGLSFLNNFIGRREYAGKTLREQMHEPYQRIVVMHVTIIIGGGISMISGEHVLALLLLVGLKITADVRAHLRQHRPRVEPAVD